MHVFDQFESLHSSAANRNDALFEELLAFPANDLEIKKSTLPIGAVPVCNIGIFKMLFWSL